MISNSQKRGKTYFTTRDKNPKIILVNDNPSEKQQSWEQPYRFAPFGIVDSRQIFGTDLAFLFCHDLSNLDLSVKNFMNASMNGEKMVNEEIQEKVLKYETFINDVLKEDLRKVHGQLELKNSEVAEWIQLKTLLNSFKESDLTEGFKTKMDIGTNVYAQVNVPDVSKILISVGAGIYVEYSIDESLILIEKRINLLNKQINIIRKNSSQIKARIKLVLHGIQELSNIK